jgi:hypothetical protein
MLIFIEKPIMILDQFFIFWIYYIQQNRQLREQWELHCSGVSLGRDSMDHEASLLLYSHMLTTGASFVPDWCGYVSTPWGRCYVKGRTLNTIPNGVKPIISTIPNGFKPIIFDPTHLIASKRLMRMLKLMTMSSSILLPRLLPRLLPGFGGCRARILMHLMRKIRYPTLIKSKTFFQKEFANFPQGFNSGWRTNLLVVPPLDSRVSAQYTPTENPCDAIFRHRRVHEGITDFLKNNPSFPLNFGELLDMVHWSFMHQQNLRKMNARIFGLTLSDRTSNQLLEMTPERIFEVANEGNLLTVALKFFLKEKEKTQKM